MFMVMLLIGVLLIDIVIGGGIKCWRCFGNFVLWYWLEIFLILLDIENSWLMNLFVGWWVSKLLLYVLIM